MASLAAESFARRAAAVAFASFALVTEATRASRPKVAEAKKVCRWRKVNRTCLVATEGFDPAGPVIENRTGLAAARAVDDLIDGDPPIWSHAQCGKDAGKNADVAISHLPMDAFPNKIPRQSHLSIRSKLFFKSPKSFLGRRQLRAESFSRTKIDVEHGCRRNRASIRFTISIPSVLPLRPLGRRIPDLVGACDRSD